MICRSLCNLRRIVIVRSTRKSNFMGNVRRCLNTGVSTENNHKDDKDNKNYYAERLFESFKLLILDVIRFFGCFHIITTYICGISLCVGPSMLPTLRVGGDLVFIDKLSHKLLNRPYEKGDVVISICPYDGEKTICKRIRAVAGDDIPSDNVMSDFLGHFYPSNTNKVPSGHVWIAGDNAANSNDSRNYGPVPLPLLLGRVIIKINDKYPYISPIDSVISSKSGDSTQ